MAQKTRTMARQGMTRVDRKLIRTLGVFLGLTCAIVIAPCRSQATVTNQAVKTQTALGNGSTTNFTIGFDFRDNVDVTVTLIDESTSPYTETIIIQGSGSTKFTISGGDPGTTVVMGTAPSITQYLVIQRVLPYTQTVSYDEAEAFPASDHEAQMDNMVFMLQQLAAQQNQSIQLSPVTAATSLPEYLPDPVSGNLWGWNYAANAPALYPGAGVPLSSGEIMQWDGNTWVPIQATSLGQGTVNSVSMSVPSWMNVTGVPITQSGTIALTLASQSTGLFVASPSGGSGAPSPRAIVSSDIAANLIGNTQLAQAPTLTLKGNNTGGTANDADLTVAQVTSMLSITSSIGTFDSGTANSNAASIVGNAIALQSASATNPGAVNTATQTFAGTKKFNSTPWVPGLDDSSGVSALTCSDRILRDLSGNPVVLWANYILEDSNGNHSVSWNADELIDTSDGASVNWLSRFLYNTSGTVVFDYSGSEPKFPVLTTPGYLTNTSAGTVGSSTAAQAFVAFFESIATTAGDLIYGGVSGTPTRLAAGASGQILEMSGGVPSWQNNTGGSLTAPQIKILTSTGTQTGWVFTVSSANATVGAVYTNNSNSYTVQGTIASGTLLFMSGTGSTSGSALSKSSGTGDSSITFSAAVASGTVTPPAGALYGELEMVGGGGGGGSTGTSAATGSTGTASYFGANQIITLPGAGGVGCTSCAYSGGAGGAATSVGSAFTGQCWAGASGGGTSINGTVSATNAGGGMGGSTPLAGGGGGGAGGTNNGSAAPVNSGAGGGGGGGTGANNGGGGGGGGAGSYCHVFITSAISASYPVVIGASGAGSTAGAEASGGNGGAGFAILTWKFQ